VLGEELSDQGRWQLQTLDPKTGALGSPFEESVPAMRWDLSPDGTRLAFPGPENVIRIRTLEAHSGSELRVTLEDLRVESVAWATAEDFIVTGTVIPRSALGAGPITPYVLLRVGSKGNAQRLHASDHWMHDPVVSPDGRTLAVGVQETVRDVWLADGL
jgi:hypothetical protein